MVVLHTVIAIGGIVALILALRVDPVIALVAGALYLGLAAGLGFEGTTKALVGGFGDIMAEVGLLIGFGVLLGALLLETGVLQRLVAGLLRTLGPGRLPYAVAAVLTALFPSIYVDVQLVLAAPLARSAAPRLGPRGLPLMGGTLTAGILVGYVFVVPGLGTVSIAGLLRIPLADMLALGLAVGVVTAVLTVLVWSRLLRAGFWDPGRDETQAELGGDTPEVHAEDRRRPPLAVGLLPVLVPLVLIASGAIASAAGLSVPVVAFLGEPTIALFVGLVGAYVLASVTVGRERTGQAVTGGLGTTGQILLITGIGGSLGNVISETGLGDVLGGLFTAGTGIGVAAAIALAWLVAAVLHLAIGSISVAAITAAGIIGPVLGQLDVRPAVIGLAIGAGALFALQVNSNFFWMFQSLLGVSTRGALKALTLVTALASTISLGLVVLLGLVL